MPGFADLIAPDAPIAVFDLDGCLRHNPYHDERTHTTCHDYDWPAHWRDESVPSHHEMVMLALGLADVGYRIAILTARPVAYIEETTRWLHAQGFALISCVNTNTISTMQPGTDDRIYEESPIFLMMMPDGAPVPSSAWWKCDVIRSMVRSGADVRFAVEDWKPNADAIRQVCPVLLYERQKG